MHIGLKPWYFDSGSTGTTTWKWAVSHSGGKISSRRRLAGLVK